MRGMVGLLRGKRVLAIACLTLVFSAVKMSNDITGEYNVKVLDTYIMDAKQTYTPEEYSSYGVRESKALTNSTFEDNGTIGYEALHQDFVTKIPAYGVYADGVYLGVVRDKQEIENKLLDIRTSAFDVDVVNVELSHDITFSDVQIEEEYLYDDTVEKALQGYEDETVYYEVKPGDSIGGIAAEYEKTLEDIYNCPWIWNGEVVENIPDNFKVGLLVLVPTNKAYIRPIVTKQEVECKEVVYNTITLNDETVPEGEIRVETHGKYGLTEVLRENTYDNGVIVKTSVLNSTLIAEPISEVVIVGTKKMPNMATGSGGTGTYFYPITSDKAYISAYMGDGRGHKGLDIAAPRGTEIYSACDGVVSKVNYTGWGGGYGIYVMVENDDGNTCMYAHMCYTALDIKEGDVVKRGQLLGYVGTTGNSTGNHLHFEVRTPDNKYMNPCNYISLD